MVQSDNTAQTSRQDQETVRTRSYTMPTGSRLEELRVTANERGDHGGWFLAHRHWQLRGLVEAANKETK